MEKKSWSRNSVILCPIMATHEIVLMVTKFGEHSGLCSKNVTAKRTKPLDQFHFLLGASMNAPCTIALTVDDTQMWEWLLHCAHLLLETKSAIVTLHEMKSDNCPAHQCTGTFVNCAHFRNICSHCAFNLKLSKSS